MKKRILILGLGNDLLGDDGVGLVAARGLRENISEDVEVVESREAGLALLDFMEGRDRVLLLDAVSTGRHPPGTILEYAPEDFCRTPAPSPHFAGIPELFRLAEELELSFPREVRILAMEVEIRWTFREGLTDAAQKSLPGLMEKAGRILEGWRMASA